MNERRDDLASAWLDDELDPAELEAWPDPAELRRARDELARARDAIAAPVGAPAGLADAQIAAALAHATEAPTTEAPTTGVAPVVPLGSARRARQGIGGSSPWLARAAAAVVVLGGLGAGAVALDRDDAGSDDEIASISVTEEAEVRAEAFSAADDAAGSGPAGGDEPAEDADGAAESAPAGPEGAAASGPVDLSVEATARLAEGAIPAEDLRRELEDRFGPAPTWPVDPAASPSCAGGPAASDDDDDGAPVAVPLERDGQPLELVVPSDGPAYFADPTTCQPMP